MIAVAKARDRLPPRTVPFVTGVSCVGNRTACHPCRSPVASPRLPLKNPLQTKVAIKRFWQESLYKIYKGKRHVGTIKIFSTRITAKSFLKEYKGVKEFPLHKSPRTLKSCLKRLGVPTTFDHIWVEILYIRDDLSLIHI